MRGSSRNPSTSRCRSRVARSTRSRSARSWGPMPGPGSSASRWPVARPSSCAPSRTRSSAPSHCRSARWPTPACRSPSRPTAPAASSTVRSWPTVRAPARHRLAARRPDWAAAPEVALDIDIARAIQHIAFGPQPDTVFGAEPLPLSAVADSGLPVSFETDGPCRILDGALVADGAGTCTITASQPGDADWEPAAAVVLDLDIARAEQAIEFAAIDGAVVGEPLPLSATADSGLPVSFEASGACASSTGRGSRPIGSGTAPSPLRSRVTATGSRPSRRSRRCRSGQVARSSQWTPSRTRSSEPSHCRSAPRPIRACPSASRPAAPAVCSTAPSSSTAPDAVRSRPRKRVTLTGSRLRR